MKKPEIQERPKKYEVDLLNVLDYLETQDHIGIKDLVWTYLEANNDSEVYIVNPMKEPDMEEFEDPDFWKAVKVLYEFIDNRDDVAWIVSW